MNILAIETSCDETAVAVVTGAQRPVVLVNKISSQIDLHAKTNGIVPEVAAREQLVAMIPVLSDALTESKLTVPDDIDAIAVTYGPGLIGSLLVGVETAKTLGAIWQKPVWGLHHIEGHIFAAVAEADPKEVTYPAIALTVSGGHTQLVKVDGPGEFTVIGTTRDDAAGEAFDKIARVLGLGYPGGPAIAAAAERCHTPQSDWPELPQPMRHAKELDFSFSGLKTAVWYAVKDRQLTSDEVAQYAAATEQAVVDVLVAKTKQALDKYDAPELWLSGGVAANKQLRAAVMQIEGSNGVKVRIPPLSLTTDNAGMIAVAGWYRQWANKLPVTDFVATPRLELSNQG